MLQAVHKHVAKSMLVFSSIILGLVIFIAIQTISAQETSQHNDMRELLEALNVMIETEAPFHVTFQFRQPLTEIGGDFWEIPYNPPNEDISRWIGEIGDDFICFYEQAGSTGIARCTPFSNIVSISYLGSP